MIPGKCLETHSTVTLCVEKFLRRQKLVEVVQKLLLFAMFFVLFRLLSGMRGLETSKIALCLRFLK